MWTLNLTMKVVSSMVLGQVNSFDSRMSDRLRELR